MTNHATHPRSRATLTGCCSFALRWLLLLAAWQGPIPWCHSHGTLSSSPGVSPWLIEHLQTHHPCVDPAAHLTFGWHFHTRMPGDPHEDPDEPRAPDQERLPLTGNGDMLAAGLARGSIAGFAPLFSLDTRLPAGLLAARFDDATSAHFFDSFAPHLALPMRLCVSRS
jgi:hypothetical protein